MRTIKVTKSHNSTYWQNRAITLLNQYHKHKKQKLFIQEIIYCLANWRLNKANIDEINITFVYGTKSLGSTYNNTIYIDYELLNGSYKLSIFTSLIDTLLHEMYHIESKIREPNKVRFSFNTVFNALISLCKYSIDEALSLTIGMYFTNNGEIDTRNQALNLLKEINEASMKVFKKNNLIARMINNQAKNNYTTRKINKDNIDIFNVNKKRLIKELTNVQKFAERDRDKKIATEIIDLISNHYAE